MSSVERNGIMTKPLTQVPITRRQLAQAALAGAAGTLAGRTAAAQNTETPPMPTAPKTADEGTFLAEAVPPSVDYALTSAQAREVAAALKDYPGEFGPARTYPIPHAVTPAWVTTPPPSVRGGRGK